MQKKMQKSSNRGKITAARMPAFKLSWKQLEIMPTRVGPLEQPKSPPRAKRANMAVPPLGNVAEALLKVPGQRIPTESPQRAQLSRPITGLGIREIPR